MTVGGNGAVRLEEAEGLFELNRRSLIHHRLLTALPAQVCDYRVRKFAAALGGGWFMGLNTCLLVLVTLATCAGATGEFRVKHPVYPSGLPRDDAQAAAAKLVRYVRMSPAELRALIPRQGGFYFCGCPNCTAGAQERNMTWSPDDPDHVRCRYCGHVYPSADYAVTGEVRVTSPLGDEQVYRYYEDAKGHRYYFEARAWYGQIHYYDGIALSLARVYDATNDERYARAATALIDEYARVFPGYVPKFDYPYKPKQFFEAGMKPPYPVEPYRAARYYWWAYGDIPRELALAYDLVFNSRALTDAMRKRIENSLIRASVDWVCLNPDTQGNMAPSLWRAMIEAGRVIGEPEYMHDAVARARRLLQEQFFYDGSWREGAPSYHLQTVGNFKQVMDVLRGYSDPPGYTSPRDGLHFQDFDPDTEYPQYVGARAAVEMLRLPDGRYAPIHDTWSKTRGEPLVESRPQILPGMGHAVLGSGSGARQTQVHIEFSGGYGHQHADNLAIIVWVNGREAFSDLGYTHTKARVWSVATASHNTVVIDQQNQRWNETDGNLLLWADGTLSCAVEADGAAVYPAASVYHRLLALVERPGTLPFLVDIFRVAGGQTHDWFLHGCADEGQILKVNVETEPVDGSLVPEGCDFVPPENEGDWRMLDRSPALYGFLTDLRRGRTDDTWHADFTSPDGAASRLIMIGGLGSEVFTGRNISVRRADEDDARLDDFTRPFVMVRRRPTAAQSVFAAILDPTAGCSGCERITEVAPLILDDEAVILRITSGEHTYLTASCSDPGRLVTCQSQEGPVAFRGRYGVIRRGDDSVVAELVGATEFSWGDHRFKGSGRLQGRVVAVGPHSFDVETEMTDMSRLEGGTVIITHGNGTTHGYRIAGATQLGLGRVRLTVPATGLEYDPAVRMTRFTTFPLREIAGENRFAMDLMGRERRPR